MTSGKTSVVSRLILLISLLNLVALGLLVFGAYQRPRDESAFPSPAGVAGRGADSTRHDPDEGAPPPSVVQNVPTHQLNPRPRSGSRLMASDATPPAGAPSLERT